MANVQENIARFMSVQEKAKKLIQMDNNGQLDNVVNNAKANGRIDYSLTEDVEPLMEQPQQNYNYQQAQMPQNVRNNKLPKEILESMTTNQIDTSALSVPGVGGSVLDHLNAMTNGNLLKEEKPKKAVKKAQVTENIQPIVQNATVDYSMIKMIVEETMKKYTSALKKQIISENKSLIGESSDLSAMKIGKKFSFIDNKGNLYEAQLKFIKNINQS